MTRFRAPAVQGSSPPELRSLALADSPDRWRELGFSLDGDQCPLGPITVSLGAPGHGIVGWDVSGVDHEVDGLPVIPPASRPTPSSPHQNGATGIDHLVVLTPDFDRTSRALEAAGLPLRRVVERPDGARMGFRRLGPVILEVVEARDAADGPSRFWGLVVIVADLEALAERLGSHLGPIKPAVQPRRRIATLSVAAGLQEAVAFMDPET